MKKELQLLADIFMPETYPLKNVTLKNIAVGLQIIAYCVILVSVLFIIR